MTVSDIDQCGNSLLDHHHHPSTKPAKPAMHGHGIAMGNGLISARINVFNEFLVHTTHDSGLNISVEGPGNVQMRYIENDATSIRVQYKPQLPGHYKVHVRQNGIPVRGSPFDVTVYDQETIEPFLPKATIEMENIDPYQQQQQQPAFGCPKKVVVSGRNLHRGISNVQGEIVVDTRKAGLGRVNWHIDGPAPVQTRRVNIISGIHKLLYVANTKGLYVVFIKFNEQDVPGSPYKLRIM